MMRNETRKRKTLIKMAGCAGAALLVLICVLQVRVFLAHTPHDVTSHKASCQLPNYQYGCQDGVCEFSVRWWRRADLVNVELTTLVSDVTEDIKAAIVIAQKAVFMCQWSREGLSLANCSLPKDGEVGQAGCLIANSSFINPLLKCSFGVSEDGRWLESPVSLEIKSWSHSGSDESVQQVGPECLCDIRDCLDTCSCEVTGNKCHSSLYLLLIRSHAITMVIAFLLLLPTGGMISRYSRPVFPHSWFRAHVLANTTGLFFMLLGLAAILGHTRGGFSVGLHQVVGIICISLVLFQALYGFLRPVAGTSLWRHVFSYVHRTTGIAILGLGTLALLLGSILYRNSIYTVIVVVVVVAIVVEVVLIVAMEIIMRRNYVISPPVGYQRVQGRGDDEGEGEGEGESDKELYVKEGAITQPKPIPEELSKSYPTHTSTKRVLAIFLAQGFVFSAVISILLSYGEH